LAIAAAFIWPTETGRSEFPWLLIFLLPVLAMSFLTDINLGLRYVLPALPFLYLFAGSAVQAGRPAWIRLLAAAAIVWNLAALARIHPHELAYFNELVGGPANGRFHLIDSNLDWGQ